MRRALSPFAAALLSAAACVSPAADWTVPGAEPVESVRLPGPEPGAFASARFVSPTNVSLVVSLPPGFALPLSSLAAHAPGAAAELDLPEPDAEASEHAGEPAAAGDVPVGVRFDVPPAAGSDLSFSCRTCGPDLCYPPATVRFAVPESVAAAPAPSPAAATSAAADPVAEALRELGFAKLRVVRTLPHAADADEFVRFVRGGTAAEPPAVPSGRAAYLLWLLLAGFLLNLTPCVLPLVPVNLALLGAGAGRRSRKSGFALGAAFGLGIALVYGALGLFSAATGRAFGFLHGHLAFHVAFAVLFCLLALAMLDSIRIDFSRLRNLLPRRRATKGPAAAEGSDVGAVIPPP